mmetsp:Transcript_80806/g.227511  ORF Transcript_80806/g.227511 Transcript_80806/m.227511 type:complete len:278 (-) Transcript_80806:553-1386(-)
MSRGIHDACDRIVDRVEWSVDGVAIIANEVLHFSQALSNEVGRLISRDRVGLLGSNLGIKLLDYRVPHVRVVPRDAAHLPTLVAGSPCRTPLHLAEAAQDAGAHDPHTRVIGVRGLHRGPHEAELDSEPVDARQAGDGLVGGPQGRQADLLRELREVGVGEQRHVSDQLVADVGLGGVEWVAAVADVLRAAECAERQGVEEVASREQSADRSQTKAGLGRQVLADVIQLRDLIRPVAGLGLQFRQDLIEFLASPTSVATLQLLVDGLPHSHLLRGVF